MWGLTVSDVISIIGTIVSVIAFLYTLRQVAETKKAAIAAKEASTETRASINESILLFDVAHIADRIEDIKKYIHNDKLEIALIRTSDIVKELNRLKALEPIVRGEESEIRVFQHSIAQLAVLRDNLDKKIANDENKSYDKLKTLEILSKINDKINNTVGKIQHTHTKKRLNP